MAKAKLTDLADFAIWERGKLKIGPGIAATISICISGGVSKWSAFCQLIVTSGIHAWVFPDSPGRSFYLRTLRQSVTEKGIRQTSDN
jgi:hypothetical protein